MRILLKMSDTGVEEPRNEDISITDAIFIMVNTTIGIGVLNIPQTFSFSGSCILAIFYMAVVLALVVWGIMTLVIISIKHKCDSLQGIILRTGSIRLAFNCSIVIIAYGFACCSTCLIIIGDELDRVMYTLISPTFCHSWYLRREFTTITISTLIIFPNIYSKKISFLRYISKIGTIGEMYVIFMIIGFYFFGNIDRGPMSSGPKGWNEMTYIFPTFCFSFHCHVQVVPIVSCVLNKTIKSGCIIVATNYTICFILYSLVGTFGYLSFGDNVMANIMIHYNPGNPVVAVGLFIICLKMCCAYPVHLFCGRTAIIDIYCYLKQLDIEEHEFKLRIVIATALHLMAIMLAILVPNIGLIIGFTGCFVVVFIFFVPGLSQILTAIHNPENKWTFSNKLLGTLLSVVGLILIIVTFTQSIRRLIKAVSTGTESLCKP